MSAHCRRRQRQRARNAATINAHICLNRTLIDSAGTVGGSGLARTASRAPHRTSKSSQSETNAQQRTAQLPAAAIAQWPQCDGCMRTHHCRVPTPSREYLDRGPVRTSSAGTAQHSTAQHSTAQHSTACLICLDVDLHVGPRLELAEHNRKVARRQRRRGRRRCRGRRRRRGWRRCRGRRLCDCAPWGLGGGDSSAAAQQRTSEATNAQLS